MSRPQYGNGMDQSSTADIIRRARERAEAGQPREDYDTFLQRQAAMSNVSPAAPSIPPRSRPPRGPQGGGPPRQQPRPQAPPGFQNKDGQINLPISRPAPVPQWPLPGPLASPASPANLEPYRPPAGSQPPQRPPRPSKVPSILDASKLQDHTPVFQYEPQNNRDSEDVTTASVLETQSTLSRPSTMLSEVSIPDFPLPMQAPVPPPMGLSRRSVTLGPPPSARRGASSFYSHLSYVSPIPEESPRSRSHASYASSAAMPESWGTPSPPAQSPRFPDAFYDDTIVEEGSLSEAHSMNEDGDESRLVRSASIGRRGKAALVTTGTQEATGLVDEEYGQRPSPAPLQSSPFPGGTGYLDASSNSSSTVPSARTPDASAAGAALTTDDILNAYDAASSADPRASKGMPVSPQPPPFAQQPRGFSRLSAIRRPPRLDMDAVREAEARGSMTSLPDLIRRATRLAASLDRGKRPASRINDLDDFPPEFYGDGTKLSNKDFDEYYDKHQSGFSDMLAAFPPPAQAQSRQGGTRQSFRDSVFSWPLHPFNRSNNNLTPRGRPGEMTMSDSPPEKKGRRCCGLPLWGFILLMIIIAIVVAAAIVVPIEFFVLRRQNVPSSTMAAAEQQCESQVICQNGGTNVVTDGLCSCICTNGFTGFDCSTADNVGCTSADISGDANISNVTVGDAIPRLISQAKTNFSVPLSGTTILSKLNAGNLSCTAENALVTFDGQSGSLNAATDTVSGIAGTSEAFVEAAAVKDDTVATITVMAGQSSTTTLTIDVASSTIPPTTTITVTKTFTSIWPPASSTAAATTTSASSPPAASSGTAFTATEEVLDFARVGILYILEKDTLDDATTAQSMLQMFFASTTTTNISASNISLSAGNSIDLVNFSIDAGMGLVGSMPATSSKRELEGVVELWDRHWTGPLE